MASAERFGISRVSTDNLAECCETQVDAMLQWAGEEPWYGDQSERALEEGLRAYWGAGCGLCWGSPTFLRAVQALSIRGVSRDKNLRGSSKTQARKRRSLGELYTARDT